MKKLFSLSFVLSLAFVFSACGQFTSSAPVARTLTGYSFTTNKPTNISLGGFAFGDFLDTNAVAFASRAGLTNRGDLLSVLAVDSLVKQLKGANLWTNLYALYPFVGTTSNAMACNLVSTNYTITWHGTNTFNRYGVLGDGVSGYGDTGMNPVTAGINTNSIHLFAWNSALGTSEDGRIVLGAAQGSSNAVLLEVDVGTPGGVGFFGDGDNRVSAFTAFSGGNLLATQTTNSLALYKTGGTVTNTVLAISYLPNLNLYVGAENASGTASSFFSDYVRAASIGRGLTPAQSTNYMAIMTRFQSLLSRATP